MPSIQLAVCVVHGSSRVPRKVSVLERNSCWNVPFDSLFTYQYVHTYSALLGSAEAGPNRRCSNSSSGA